MDKNFISVDDLVRQHLGGAEEQERAGAWLNMRDLLDKEMPQKRRIAGFYWRRLFGLVAVASLVGSLAVGGYELSAAYRSSNNGPVAAVTPSPAASKESGRGAMEVNAMDMENEPATAGNITVRGNSHIASVAHENRSANADVALTESSNTMAGNTSTGNNTQNDNNSNNSIAANTPDNNDEPATTHNTVKNKENLNTGTTTTQNTRSIRTNADNSATIAANKTNSSKTNNYNSSVVTTTPVAGKDITARRANETSTTAPGTNVVTTMGSRAVPDKPVTGDNNRARNTRSNSGNTTTGSKHNTTSGAANVAGRERTTSTSATKPVASNVATNAKDAKENKPVATNNTGKEGSATAMVTGHRRNKTQTNKTTAPSAKTDGVAANGGEIAVAKNDAHNNTVGTTPVAGNNNGGKQDMSVLNSSAPATMATDVNAAGATTKAVPQNNTATNTGATAAGTTQKRAGEHIDAMANTGASVATEKATPAIGVTKTVPGVATTNKPATTTNTPAVAAKDAAVKNDKAGVASNTTAQKATTGKPVAANDKATATTANTTATNTKTAAKNNGTKPVSVNTYAAAKQNKGKTTATSKPANGKHDGAKSTADEDALASVDTENGDVDQKQDPDQKTITKIVVREREVKDNDNQILMKVDTVSMERMNKDNGNKKDKEPVAATTTPAAKKGTATPAAEEETPAVAAAPTTASTEENEGTSSRASRRKHRHHNANSGEDNGIAASADGMAEGETAPAAAPAAAAEEAANTTTTAATETKTKAKAHKHSGVSVLQRLSAAFNDVKTQARGATFTGGITAGINSNFFGPSKMKGFQFGMTGNWEFSETWNMMAELKYFHRLNSNTIDDSYYSYEQKGGQWERTLMQNTYDFAAMHSIEMPLTIRYANGNFNFYTGGNFLYTFSINTAAATMPSLTVAPTMVNAPGTDDKPQFVEKDFNARFGLGYIFGFAYQVAPNTSLDLRTVQTVWDNAPKTDVGRSLSGQLYRTPSLQLSIMYRLGGNRNKE